MTKPAQMFAVAWCGDIIAHELFYNRKAAEIRKHRYAINRQYGSYEVVEVEVREKKHGKK